MSSLLYTYSSFNQIVLHPNIEQGINVAVRELVRSYFVATGREMISTDGVLA